MKTSWLKNKKGKHNEGREEGKNLNKMTKYKNRIEGKKIIFGSEIYVEKVKIRS